MARKKIADRADGLKRILARIEADPGTEVPYFEAAFEVVESIDDFSDRDVRASAMLSRVAVTAPWLADLVTRRAA